jgi:hypothetical protein
MSVNDEEVDLKTILADIQKRLASLEIKFVENKETSEQEESKNEATKSQTTNQASTANEESSKLTQVDGDVGQTIHQYQEETELEIQKEYQSIKDSVSRVTLDPVLRLCEGPCPVGTSNKVERATYFTLTKSSRYVETALKIVKLCYKDLDEKGTIGTEYVDQIATILKAHIDHNQKEYQAVLVAAQFDAETAKVFRTLQKNAACFTNAGIAQMKVAAELAAIKGQASAQNTSSNRYHSQRPQFYGRGRGFRNSGYQYNQGYNRGRSRQQGRDVFHDLSGNQFPPYSPNDGHD